MRATLLLVLLVVAPPVLADPLAPIDLARALESAFVQVASSVSPAVVTLDVIGGIPSDGEVPPELREMFGDRDPELYPFAGKGSGLIVAADGTIYTNRHVVSGADEIGVTLKDGRRFQAIVVGTDEESDIAVIRIHPPPLDLPVATLGDSDSLRVGQYAIAIGSPLGLQDSFAVGHISAKGRRSLGQIGSNVQPGFEKLSYQDFIQVDTPIHQGNSGGPLVDIEGRVIGLNTAIMGAGGGGLGFAIPVNMVREVARQLLDAGQVQRGWLGVEMTDLSSELVKALDLPADRGALVHRVLAGGPAARAHVEEDDIIVAFGDKPIRGADDLRTAVAAAALGSTASLKVLRIGARGVVDELQIPVVLAARPRPEEAKSVATEPTPSAPSDGTWLQQKFGLDLDQRAHGGKAVVVDHVERGSRAAAAGLEPGDVLREVDRKAVKSVSDVERALRDAGRRFVALLVERAGKTKPMAIESP